MHYYQKYKFFAFSGSNSKFSFKLRLCIAIVAWYYLLKYGASFNYFFYFTINNHWKFLHSLLQKKKKSKTQPPPPHTQNPQKKKKKKVRNYIFKVDS